MNPSILDSIDRAALGRRLQRARKKQGLTQEQAADLIGVARTTITAIEKGERRIKAGELIKLAGAYGQQVNDLLRQRPEAEPFQVQFRSSFSRSEDDFVVVQSGIDTFEELCRNYQELERITEMPLARRYPPEYQLGGLGPEQAAEDVAEDERTRLGLGDSAISDLRDILEQDVGLRIFYIPIKPSKYSEMYFYSEDLGGCIAVNRLHSEERRRWSLAHGYARFLLRRYTPDVLVDESYRRLPEAERFADHFAGCFLMPAHGLRRRFNDQFRAKGGITIADLLGLANYYGVSLEAAIRRLESMHLLPTGQWEEIKAGGFRVREAQLQLGLDSLPANEEMYPKRYEYLAWDALDKGLITEGQYARFLHLDRLEARKAAATLREEMGRVEGGSNLGLTQALDL
jgi:Zn-dependent peptidase ImmA (M78 family)/transcriptional regulator with XRE-family HTH domain